MRFGLLQLRLCRIIRRNLLLCRQSFRRELFRYLSRRRLRHAVPGYSLAELWGLHRWQEEASYRRLHNLQQYRLGA